MLDWMVEVYQGAGAQIIVLAFLLSALVASIVPAHMMQLSFYQAPGYLRWLRQDGLREIARRAGVALAIPVIYWGRLLFRGDGNAEQVDAAAFFAILAVFAAGIALCRPRRAKKPFKYTARAVRLLAAQFVLLYVVAVFSFTQEGMYSLLPTGYLATLLLIIPANWITLPIQNAVNNWYTRDAQRMLREHPDLTIIGITGSYGKTSMKNYLAVLLSIKYNVLATPASYNTPMGIVRAVRENLKPTHNMFICEMGARHLGNIGEDCKIVPPFHGMLTSIGPQHLETFKTIENIISTKFELIEAVPPEGLAFLGWDNEHIKAHNKREDAVKYGLGEDCDYTGTDIQISAEGCRFTVAVRETGERHSYTTKLLGRHSVENLVGAIAVAHKLGVPLADMTQAVYNLKPAPHRLNLLPKGNGITIIDDTYNANVAGTRAALDTLHMFDAIRVLVTPGMVELGDREEEENRAFGAYAAKICDYVALVGGRLTEPIAEGLRENGMENFQTFPDLQSALDWVYAIERDDREMAILLANDLPDNY